jgi:urease accessory protein
MINKCLLYLLLPLLLPLFMADTAMAHSSDGNGFYAGLTHPVGGLDHLLAMLSVGILSTQMQGRHIWLVPTTFVTVMLLGGVVGLQGSIIPMSVVEYGIVLSVILLGLVIAMGGTMPFAVIYSFVAFFGFAHGYAHGVELPELAKPQFFVAGFVLSTIMIHIAGVIIGFVYAVGKEKGMLLLRYTGALIMGMGMQMLLDSVM